MNGKDDVSRLPLKCVPYKGKSKGHIRANLAHISAMNEKDDAREKMEAATQTEQGAIAASAAAAAAKAAADAAAQAVAEVKNK